MEECELDCLLTDVDIRQMIKTGEMGITPFEEECLTPVGYDLRVGELGFSWKTRKFSNIKKDEKIVIDPGDTVLISTMENVFVSNRIGGTIHSKVSLSFGFSHVSTTVDPGWKGGKMLIQLSNKRAIPLYLKFGEPFCTLVFHAARTPAKKPAPKRDPIEKFICFLAEEEKRQRTLTKRLKEYLHSKPLHLLIAIVSGYGITAAIFSLLLLFLGVEFDVSYIGPLMVAGGALSAAIMAKI